MKAVDGVFGGASEDIWATTNTLAVCANFFASRTLYVRVQDSWGRWSTRQGLYWDANSETCRFDPAAGWADATVQLQIAPDVASNPSPGANQLVVLNDHTVSFAWQACRGISGHELYARRDISEPFTLWASGSTNNFFSTNLASPYGYYEWIVRSVGGTEGALDGSLWPFFATSLGAGDADKDGLPDDWEREKVGILTVMNGATDRDKDGLLDWQEYVAGTDPLKAGDEFRLIQVRTVPGKYADLGYPIGLVTDWMSVAGREYSLYYTTNLANKVNIWVPFDKVEGTGEMVSVTNFFPDPTGFYRLGVSLPGF